MDLPGALERLAAEVDRRSVRDVASDIAVAHTTVSGWLEGAEPKGQRRKRLLEWAERLGPVERFKYAPHAGDRGRIREGGPVPVGQVIREAQATTEENLVRLSEISGYAKAVLSMMQAVTDAQSRVVASLEPYVVAEEQLTVGPADPGIEARIKADMIASALASAAAPKGRAAGDRSKR